MNKLDLLTDSFKTKLERFTLGCDSIEELGLWDKDKNGEMDVYYTNDLLSIILRLIIIDGNITPEEVAYLNSTFDFDYTKEELENVYKRCAELVDDDFDKTFAQGVKTLEPINEKLAQAYKDLLFTVSEIIVESDGVEANEETEEIKKLQELCK